MQKIKLIPNDRDPGGWYATSQTRSPRPSQRGETSAPWVIVGAGITGLVIARYLALNFPDEQIILVDAQEVGYGASGKNAGFIIDLPHNIGEDDYIGNPETAKTILDLNLLGQKIIFEQVQGLGIDCQLQKVGKYQAAVENKGLAVLEAYKSGLDKLGQSYEMIEKNELSHHLGTSFYQRALYTAGTALVQPAALVKGLAESLPDNVSLYENTPITCLEQGEQIRLVHEQGCIVTDRLILANNALSMSFGFLKQQMLPLTLYASLSEPMNQEQQARLGGKPSWGVIPADPFGSTVRRTPDNRILIRNSFNFNPRLKDLTGTYAEIKKRHRLSFENRFPMLQDLQLEHTWSGVLALTTNNQSFFGQLAPRVYGVVGCNGLGMTRGAAAGYLLAQWLANQPHPLIDYLLTSKKAGRFPPEPFLTIGVKTRLYWGSKAAGKEK